MMEENSPWKKTDKKFPKWKEKAKIPVKDN
jgi:hypothetical protein